MTWAKADIALLARPDLSAAAKIVYVVLADRQAENGSTWPSIRRIATDCGISSVTAQRAIRKLREAGLITVESAGPNRGRRTNRYVVCVSETNTQESTECIRNEHTTEKPVSETNTQCVFETTNEPDQVNQTKKKRPSGATRRAETNGNATSELIAYFCERYKALAGVNPKINGRAAGQMGHVLKLASGDVGRAKLAIDMATSRSPPWQFKAPGDLTIKNVALNFEALEDARNRNRNTDGFREGIVPEVVN